MNLPKDRLLWAFHDFFYTKYISYSLTLGIFIISVGFTEPGLSQGKGENLSGMQNLMCVKISGIEINSILMHFLFKKSRLMQNRNEKTKILNKDGLWLFILLPYANLGFVSFCLDYLKYCIKILLNLIAKVFGIFLNFILEAGAWLPFSCLPSFVTADWLFLTVPKLPWYYLPFLNTFIYQTPDLWWVQCHALMICRQQSTALDCKDLRYANKCMSYFVWHAVNLPIIDFSRNVQRVPLLCMS